MATTIDDISDRDYKRICGKIRTYLKEQKPYWEVEYNVVYEDFPKLELDQELYLECYREVNEALMEELELNAENVMLTHASRYEQIYNKNRYPKDGVGKEITVAEKLVNHYMTAIDALRRKERVLGVVFPNMTPTLKASFETTTRDYSQHVQDSKFDPRKINLEKLTSEEKMEMLTLLEKSKTKVEEFETTSITTNVTIKQEKEMDPINDGDEDDQINTNESDVVVEDVEHEDVTDEPKETPHRMMKKVLDNEKEAFDKKMRREKLLKKVNSKKKK